MHPGVERTNLGGDLALNYKYAKTAQIRAA